MLEIYKGKSSKSYENMFFRNLALSLSDTFATKGWNGLLVGMPKSQFEDSLQIDCLLITNNFIIIIDFKKYGGELKLPPKNKFDTGVWNINKDIPVKGGSSPNPYLQLGKQRGKLFDLLQHVIPSFSRNTIHTMVCFHSPISVIGSIPSDKISFYIVDPNTIISTLEDIIDVEGSRHYLDYKELFTNQLFIAPKYDFSTAPIQKSPVISQSEQSCDHSDTDANRSDTTNSVAHLNQIQNFLQSDDKFLLLTGNTKSGKTSYIQSIRELAFQNNYYEVPVYTFSNKSLAKMMKHHPEIEDVNSLFGLVYDFSKEKVVDLYKKEIPIRNDIVYDAEFFSIGKELYIFDDAHLITNHHFENQILLGTGCLLDDLMTYLQLDQHPERKVIFIGDSNSIGYHSENVTNRDYLEKYLLSKKICSHIHTITLKERNHVSEIVNACNHIAKCIAKDTYHTLLLTSTEAVKQLDIPMQHAALKETFSFPYQNRFLTSTNEDATKINQYIKKNYSQHPTKLSPGDFIILNSSINAIPISRTNTSCVDSFDFERLENGIFAMIKSVDEENRICFHVNINQSEINLSFLPCEIVINSGENPENRYQIYLWENYLYSNAIKNDSAEFVAYLKQLQLLLAKESSALFEFEKSIEYESMRRKNEIEPYYIQNDKGEYRLKADQRSLPPEVKQYRKKMEKALQKDVSSNYFKLLNAAQANYAWAITVKKSLVYSFENVYMNVSHNGKSRMNKKYYKWLYSGLACAERSMGLIRWENIIPFMETEFRPESGAQIPTPRNYIYQFSTPENKAVETTTFLQGIFREKGWNITLVKESSYLFLFEFTRDQSTLHIFFDYNGKNELKSPRLKEIKAGTIDEFNEIYQSLIPIEYQPSPAPACFNLFFDCMEMHHIKTKVIRTEDWCVYLEVTLNSKTIHIKCYYDKSGKITIINHIDGATEGFVQLQTLLQNYYH